MADPITVMVIMLCLTIVASWMSYYAGYYNGEEDARRIQIEKYFRDKFSEEEGDE